MRAPAYSLWDAIYAAECSSGRRAALGSAEWRRGVWGRALVSLVSRTAWRRSLRRRPVTTLFGAALLMVPLAVAITVLWACVEPRSLRYLLSAVGIESPTKVVSTGLIVLGVAGLLAAAGTIVRPWVHLGWLLRPSRRWRLWGYQAGAAGRGPPDYLDVLGKEHASRVGFWHARLRASAGARSQLAFFSVDPLSQQLSVSVGLIFVLWVGMPWLVGGRPFSPSDWRLGCFFPVVAWSPFITGVARRRLAVRRLLRTLEHSHCPDCGYDLFAVPPALPTDKVPGAGPSRCPECGSMWPLVPPPVDIDEG